MFLRQQMLGGLQWGFHRAAFGDLHDVPWEPESDFMDRFWLWARGA